MGTHYKQNAPFDPPGPGPSEKPLSREEINTMFENLLTSLLSALKHFFSNFLKFPYAISSTKVEAD